jgi:hypothetical protein
MIRALIEPKVKEAFRLPSSVSSTISIQWTRPS